MGARRRCAQARAARLSLERAGHPPVREFGFEREGLRKDHYRRGGEYVDAILMAFRVPDEVEITSLSGTRVSQLRHFRS